MCVCCISIMEMFRRERLYIAAIHTGAEQVSFTGDLFMIKKINKEVSLLFSHQCGCIALQLRDSCQIRLSEREYMIFTVMSERNRRSVRLNAGSPCGSGLQSTSRQMKLRHSTDHNRSDNLTKE